MKTKPRFQNVLKEIAECRENVHLNQFRLNPYTTPDKFRGMRDADYDHYDDLSEMDTLREILSNEGFVTLTEAYAGRYVYVNSKFDPRQFTDVLSEEDAKVFVETFAGSSFPIQSKRQNAQLLLSILWMQGYVTREIASAYGCTQNYVFKAKRELLKSYPALTVLKACQSTKHSDVPNREPHRRWASVYRRSRFAAFLEQVNSIETLRVQAEIDLLRIKRLKNCLPEDPCKPTPLAPWRKEKAFADYAPVEAVE